MRVKSIDNNPLQIDSLESLLPSLGCAGNLRFLGRKRESSFVKRGNWLLNSLRQRISPRENSLCSGVNHEPLAPQETY